jgi:hypothetical protein
MAMENLLLLVDFTIKTFICNGVSNVQKLSRPGRRARAASLGPLTVFHKHPRVAGPSFIGEHEHNSWLVENERHEIPKIVPSELILLYQKHVTPSGKP